MTTQLSIDRDRTALLVMDYQNDIVGSVSGNERTGLLHRASSVVAATRKAGVPVVYVVVSFRPGHPEVSTRNKSFSAMKSTGRLREGTPGAEVHGSVRPDPGEVVVTKRRVGAFSTTDMETVLRSMGVTNLVLAGISTSGGRPEHSPVGGGRGLRGRGAGGLLRRPRPRGAQGPDGEGIPPPGHGGPLPGLPARPRLGPACHARVCVYTTYWTGKGWTREGFARERYGGCRSGT